MGQYTVQQGDSWFRIAERVYGDQRMAGALMRANANLGTLRAGQLVSLVNKQSNPTVTTQEMGNLDESGLHWNPYSQTGNEIAQLYLGQQQLDDFSAEIVAEDTRRRMSDETNFDFEFGLGVSAEVVDRPRREAEATLAERSRMLGQRLFGSVDPSPWDVSGGPIRRTSYTPSGETAFPQDPPTSYVTGPALEVNNLPATPLGRVLSTVAENGDVYSGRAIFENAVLMSRGVPVPGFFRPEQTVNNGPSSRGVPVPGFFQPEQTVNNGPSSRGVPVEPGRYSGRDFLAGLPAAPQDGDVVRGEPVPEGDFSAKGVGNWITTEIASPIAAALASTFTVVYAYSHLLLDGEAGGHNMGQDWLNAYGLYQQNFDQMINADGSDEGEFNQDLLRARHNLEQLDEAMGFQSQQDARAQGYTAQAIALYQGGLGTVDHFTPILVEDGSGNRLGHIGDRNIIPDVMTQEMTEAMAMFNRIYMVDENGNIVYDEAGNPVPDVVAFADAYHYTWREEAWDGKGGFVRGGIAAGPITYIPSSGGSYRGTAYSSRYGGYTPSNYSGYANTQQGMDYRWRISIT